MNENEQRPKVYTISQITRGIKRILEGRPELTGVWITGEVFNLTYHSSGHIYFSLRDDDAVINAVFFRHVNKNLDFKLKEGMTVLAQGSITVYEKRGSYQITISAVRPAGLGELQKRIDMLKERLLKEGAFDPARKRPLPLLPRRIGIATSPTGAAVRDIIKVALRRYPTMELVIAPALVQGVDAPVSIARAIEELNRREHRVDCIIAGRGGGSFEDLMAFNEEITVRAFLNSRVPIISAVGHQVDHPLSDDAADAAAPTPSAAAEIAVPEKTELAAEVDYYEMRGQRAVMILMESLSTRLGSITERRIFRDPYEIINRKELELLDLQNALGANLKETVSSSNRRLLLIPDIRFLMGTILRGMRHRHDMAMGALEQLSPRAVLKRGYAIPLDENEKVVRGVVATRPGARINLIMNDGSIRCGVETVHPGGCHGEEKTGETGG